MSVCSVGFVVKCLETQEYALCCTGQRKGGAIPQKEVHKNRGWRKSTKNGWQREQVQKGRIPLTVAMLLAMTSLCRRRRCCCSCCYYYCILQHCQIFSIYSTTSSFYEGYSTLHPYLNHSYALSFLYLRSLASSPVYCITRCMYKVSLINCIYFQRCTLHIIGTFNGNTECF